MEPSTLSTASKVMMYKTDTTCINKLTCTGGLGSSNYVQKQERRYNLNKQKKKGRK
jgi:hypothetical protein